MLSVSDARDLSHLLFVTSSGKLGRNIGISESAMSLDFVWNNLKGQILDLPEGSTAAAASSVRKELQTGNYRGVVIIGGYDVVPPNRLDSIDPQLRQQLVDENKSGCDADYYIVWSDDIYGDRDGDNLAEIPVSRIPDGRSSPNITLQCVNHYPFGFP